MKGGLATMCAALEVFEAGALKDTLGYRIAITPDEEIGNPASADALREAARRGPGAQVGMTYEPALEDGGLAGARKGSGNFSLVIRGRAAHAGRAHHEGRSAILAASRFVVGLEGLNGQRDGVTFNAAKVEGGAPNNQVPDIAVVRFNARIPDSDAQAWAEVEIGSLCDMVNSLDGITADLHGSFYRPAKPFNAAQQALFEGVRDTGRAIGLDLHWTPTGGVCEGNNIFAAGVPNIDTLGVRGDPFHRRVSPDRKFRGTRRPVGADPEPAGRRAPGCRPYQVPDGKLTWPPM
jgi:glutamate carboxypeptidase